MTGIWNVIQALGIWVPVAAVIAGADRLADAVGRWLRRDEKG